MMRSTIARLGLAAVLAAGAGFVAACGSASSDSHGGHMGDASMSATQMMSADAMFAVMMIPHHEQAVTMSELAPGRASSPEILELAQEIKAAQDPEIQQMRAWLSEWGVPEMNMDDMGAHGGHGGMDGMLTQAQLDELEAAKGAEFDRLFATYMIEHHEGAIEMAEEVIASGSDPRVRTLAETIIVSQQAEIDQMKAFLAG